ncbi:MAG TPA: hypothetical protein VE844_18945, partial [Gammaproteobacteria bacterium]|nr:hypothetical protein [Gammaproteobacteria bacterium]
MRVRSSLGRGPDGRTLRRRAGARRATLGRHFSPWDVLPWAWQAPYALSPGGHGLYVLITGGRGCALPEGAAWASPRVHAARAVAW